MWRTREIRASRAVRAALGVLLLLALTAPARRALAGDEEVPYSSFYFREAIGLGVFSAESSYDSGRTRQAVGFTFHVASTMGARLTRSLAIGGTFDALPMPPLTVVEKRGSGSTRDLAASFGWAGLVGPSATLMLDRLRFEVAAGLFWCVTGAAEGEGSGATLGGFGGGLGPSAAYDIPIAKRLSLGFEGRVLVAGYGNGDSTHTGGWSLTGTVLVGLRSR